MARKLLGTLGIFLAVVFLTGGHCGNDNNITGPLATATPAPTAAATSTPAPTLPPTAVSTATPSGPTRTPAPPTATPPPASTSTPAPPTSTAVPPTSTPAPPTATPAPGAPTVDGFESNPPAHAGDVFDVYGTNVDSTNCHSTWTLKNSGGTSYPLTCQFGSDVDAQLQVPLGTPAGTYVICVHRTDGQQACSSFTVTLN